MIVRARSIAEPRCTDASTQPNRINQIMLPITPKAPLPISVPPVNSLREITSFPNGDQVEQIAGSVAFAALPEITYQIAQRAFSKARFETIAQTDEVEQIDAAVAPRVGVAEITDHVAEEFAARTRARAAAAVGS